MNWKCLLGLHDWKYEKRIWYADHGACFDQYAGRTCETCGKRDINYKHLRGPYPCSDNEPINSLTETVNEE